MERDGKFGPAALAISVTSSAILLVLLALGIFLVLTGRTRASGINYFIGMTILFCWLFELVAIVVGIIGIFENSGRRRFALAAIGISTICFLGTFVPVLMGMHIAHH